MKKVIEAIDAAINSGNIVGTSIIVVQDGNVLLEYHAGQTDREAGLPVTSETIFRLSSLTKPLVSAATMVLIEKGAFTLGDPITRWLPEFTPKLKDGSIPVITIAHLLNHTSGLAYGFLFEDNEPYRSFNVSDGLDESVLSLDENLSRLAKAPLMFAPGSAWCYSLSTDVLGAILEKICNIPLPEIIRDYVTAPLGMDNTMFYVDGMKLNKLAKAYADGSGDEIARVMESKDQVLLDGCGPIHYAPGRITNIDAYPSGGAGMAGTARDYIKFLETIRQGGYGLLGRESIELLTHDSVPDFDVAAAGPGFGFGMGFAVVRDSEEAGTPRSEGSYEWGGVYGNKMFVDPVNNLSVVILTNTALYGLTQFPNELIPAIYESLELNSKLTSSAPGDSSDSNDENSYKMTHRM